MSKFKGATLIDFAIKSMQEIPRVKRGTKLSTQHQKKVDGLKRLNVLLAKTAA